MLFSIAAPGSAIRRSRVFVNSSLPNDISTRRHFSAANPYLTVACGEYGRGILKTRQPENVFSFEARLRHVRRQ